MSSHLIGCSGTFGRFLLWRPTQNFDFSCSDPAAEFPRRFLVPCLKFPQRFLVPAVKKGINFHATHSHGGCLTSWLSQLFYSLVWKHHPVLVLRCWLNRRSSSRSLIGQQLQQQLARRCQAASLSTSGPGMRCCCTPRQSRIWRVRTFRTRCRLARFGPAWSWTCLDAVEGERCWAQLKWRDMNIRSGAAEGTTESPRSVRTMSGDPHQPFSLGEIFDPYAAFSWTASTTNMSKQTLIPIFKKTSRFLRLTFRELKVRVK